MSSYPVNQFSPTYFQGVQQAPAAAVGYEPRPYSYVYSPPNGELTANQFLAGDSVAIQTDADFELFAWYISEYTGAFQIRLTDSDGYQLSNGLINSGALSQSSAKPTVFSPKHMFPAGGKILIDIQDLSSATNPLQIVFIGQKLFRVKS